MLRGGEDPVAVKADALDFRLLGRRALFELLI
jgi:hypothetical protein